MKGVQIDKDQLLAEGKFSKPTERGTKSKQNSTSKEIQNIPELWNGLIEGL